MYTFLIFFNEFLYIFLIFLLTSGIFYGIVRVKEEKGRMVG